ncbi:MAG: hypothetical protein P1U62_11385 [Alteraurantiacibacter sp. bin_em_oilr2.035]|nr:hypothetical protein [Alteraurantiacibacter sp. bin_em_oilr2.035]
MFSDLYKYRARIREGGANDRTPLEDWLTECLAACLRALWNADAHMAIEVLKKFFDDSAGRELESLLNGQALRIETQVSTDDRTRPDMVFYAGDCAFLVVENKVAHTAHVDQLSGYARWLRDNCADTGPRGLAFVTHYTRPPAEFNQSSAKFSDLSVTPTTWAAVARDLTRATASFDEDSYARTLSQSFFELLGELDMATEYPTNKNLAAAEIFLAEGEGISALVNELRIESEKLGSFHKMTTYTCDPDFEKGYFAASRWCNNLFGKTGGQVFVGIWFPEIGNFKEAVLDAWNRSEKEMALDDGTKVFLNFETTTAIPVSAEGLPGDWLKIDDDEIIVFRNVSLFSGNADARAKAMKTWISERCDESLAFRKTDG